MNGPPEHASLDPLLPAEMAARAESIGAAKAGLPLLNLAALAVLAGAFIGLGANFFTTVTTSTDLGYGPARLLGGVAFSLGLILVVTAGAELFTGNNLMVMAWAGNRVSTAQLLRVWVVVYAGNFVGSVATAILVALSGQWRFADYDVGANALRIANAKVNLGFEEAFFLGVLCNGLVCLAIWLTYSARSNLDKAIAVVFPITAFVASGYEHSVANMYFIPLGLLLKSQDAVLVAAGLNSGALEELDWGSFLLNNLLPVTVGNLVGGGLLVGAVYWFIYRRNAAAT
ncbi:MAG TPA: formate/nitrite family transporter [Dehalococcoidia bacterium]|nr:formate/nitrite family transporter [Dehalococcoidia bacterium]